MEKYGRILKMVPAGLAVLALAGCGESGKSVKTVKTVQMGAPAPGPSYMPKLRANCQEFEVLLKPGEQTELLDHKVNGRADAFDNPDGTHPILTNELVAQNVDAQTPDDARNLELTYRQPDHIRNFLHKTVRQSKGVEIDLGHGFQANVFAPTVGHDGKLDADAQVCYTPTGN